MVSPKLLKFSNLDDVSDDTLSRRKSPRTPSSKRSASDEPEAEEKLKKDKKNRKIKEKKLASPVSNRIWSKEDEFVVLKGLARFKAETEFDSKVEWEAFYTFVDFSIVAKFTKEQVLGKIRKLKRRFLDHCENIKQGNGLHSSTFSNSEVFELAMQSWGEFKADNGKEMLENEEPLNLDDSGAEEKETTKEAQHTHSGEEKNEVADAENETVLKAQENESSEVLLEEHNERADEANDDEILNENGAAKTIEMATKELDDGATKTTVIEIATKELDDGAAKTMEQEIVGKESNDGDDDLCAVKDAFETLISCDLSEYRKRVEVEKLKNLGSGITKELSDEWKSICAEEKILKIKKLLYSAKLTEATSDR